MSDGEIRDQSEKYERLLRENADARFVLRLYVTGLSVNSLRAIDNIKRICEEKLRGRYDLEVVDVREHPQRARDEGLVAAPTLVKLLPLPLRRLVGDLSETSHVLVGLGVQPGSAGDAAAPVAGPA